MKNYTEIKSQKDLDELILSVGDFHDSMTKEIHMINRGGVLADHNMLMSHQFDAQVLIQSQWQPYAVELLFIDVLRISFQDALDYASATGTVRQESAANETLVFEMNFDSAFKISSRQLFYRIQSDLLGISARLTTEVPSPKAIEARILEGRWRQCLDCSEAWEDDPDEDYSVCPKCLRLTVINRHK